MLFPKVKTISKKQSSQTQRLLLF